MYGPGVYPKYISHESPSAFDMLMTPYTTLAAAQILHPDAK